MNQITPTPVRYRSKVVRVMAWQNNPGAVMPLWAWKAGRDKDGKRYFQRGTAMVVPNEGDWLVCDATGNVGVFEDREFKRAFEEDL